MIVKHGSVRADHQGADALLPFADDGDVKESATGTWLVLIVDDEADVHEVTRYALSDVEYANKKLRFLNAYSAAEAMKMVSEHPDIALIILDVVMETEAAGLDVIRYIRNTLGNRVIRIILRTGYPGQIPEKQVIVDYDINDYKSKTELTKSRLFTSVLVSLRNYELLTSIQASKESAQAECESLKKHLNTTKLANPQAFSQIITRNPFMFSLFRYVEITAPSARAVLLTGETGVGKELIAKTIHELSGRTGLLVTVNAGGLDDTLFADTLFGHEKGAYTGADKIRRGLIEMAHDGTLFLDEIGELSAPSQVKLLRLLQDHEYYRLGADESHRSDARIIVATNRNLRELVTCGKFRQDLYYRLTVHHIHLPPLRERKDDLEHLLAHFAVMAAKELKRPVPRIPEGLVPLLHQYDFPGNVREFEAMIFDAINRSDLDELALEPFRTKILSGVGTQSMNEDVDAKGGAWNQVNSSSLLTLEEMTRKMILSAITKTQGNVTKAAQLLGISRQTLSSKLKRLKVFPENSLFD